jgi:cytidylate kinase
MLIIFCSSESVKTERVDNNLRDEQYMSSKQWLQIYGIEARKLNLYDILSGVAFKHQDGVVEIMEKPSNNEHTDAVSKKERDRERERLRL